MKKKTIVDTCSVFFIIYVMTCIFIWSNSMIDAEGSRAMSSSFVTRFLALFNLKYADLSGFLKLFIKYVRKFAHYGEFALLGFLSATWNYKRFGKADFSMFRTAFLYSFFVAFIDESIQLFVFGRSGEIRDVWIDTAGIVSGLLLFLIIKLIFLRKKEKKDA